MNPKAIIPSEPPSSSHLKFAIKYRFSEVAPWQWSHGPASFGILEGELVLQQPLTQGPNIESLVKITEGWATEVQPTSTKGATLFSFSASPPPASKNLERKILGSVRDAVRFIAFSQIEPPWIGPRHGRDFVYFTEPTLLCSFLRRDGSVVTIAAPSIEDNYAILETDDEEHIVVAAHSDKAAGQPLCVFMSMAGDIETSIEVIMVHLREQMNKSQLVQKMLEEPPAHSKSHLDGILDGLGFCTWNALGLDLDTEKLLSCLRVLRENNVKVSTFLIDDGWQDVGHTAYDYSNPHRRGLSHYKADKTKLPQGLSDLAKRIKSENPEIEEIGVWHALLGYWGAFAQEGYIADNYETRDIDGKMYYADPAELKVVAPKDIMRFYNDFYTYLAESGITFAKTDVQYIVGDITEGPERADVTAAYQASWTKAVQERLGGKVISCMSQVPEMLWRILLQDKSAPVIFRNSDDYFPEIPSSHSWHIWVNAHNALFTQHLNAVLDWDMFQTSHKYGALHAASRCLSGGPVLITDIPGDHDMNLIGQMVGQAPDGRSITLRPARMAKASHAFNSIESRTLKIVNETAAGTKLLGIFNVGETDLSVFVSAREFAAIGDVSWTGGTTAIFLSHQTQQVIGPVTIPSFLPLESYPDELIQVNLEPRTSEILSGIEVTRLPRPNGELLVGVLGLVGKITGAAAVLSSSISTTSESQISLTLEVKALGYLGVWVRGGELHQDKVKASVGNQDLLSDDFEIKSHCSDDATAQILTLDIAAAWSRASVVDKRASVPVNITIAV